MNNYFLQSYFLQVMTLSIMYSGAHNPFWIIAGRQFSTSRQSYLSHRRFWVYSY